MIGFYIKSPICHVIFHDRQVWHENHQDPTSASSLFARYKGRKVDGGKTSHFRWYWCPRKLSQLAYSRRRAVEHRCWTCRRSRRRPWNHAAYIKEGAREVFYLPYYIHQARSSWSVLRFVLKFPPTVIHDHMLQLSSWSRSFNTSCAYSSSNIRDSVSASASTLHAHLNTRVVDNAIK